jgi:NRAMP (natural resistance-associated macrophage protein)-like metal ion transporter
VTTDQDRHRKLAQTLGPGLITGAADDDPSGIATYSQAGAQFGFGMLWTVVLTLPLMIAIQSVAGRIGRVTGCGLASNMRKIFPRWAVVVVVVLLLVANIVNIAADLTAMGAAADLVWPEPVDHLYVVVFAVISLLLQVFLPYDRYVRVLKWLTLALLAYVAVVFVVGADWGQVLRGALVPHFRLDGAAITMIVAVFGTTISPYLFFWQSSQEVEEIHNHRGEHALREAPAEAPEELRRIRYDTEFGMLFSNLVAFFVMLTTAVTLHAAGASEITTAADAAAALRPVAGDFAFALFALGIIGTGFLAVPVLAGSAAYAVAEAMGWRSGLAHRVKEAAGFYSVLVIAVLGGVALDFTGVDPIRALIGAAVINGVVAPVIMAVSMVIASRADVMGRFTATRLQRVLGWLATAVMAAAALALVFV